MNGLREEGQDAYAQAEQPPPRAQGKTRPYRKTDDVESDCWDGNASDVTLEHVPVDIPDPKVPLLWVDDEEQLDCTVEEQTMILWDVRVAMPKTTVSMILFVRQDRLTSRTQRNYSRRLFKTIDKQTRSMLDAEQDIEWVVPFTITEWYQEDIENIDDLLEQGHVLVIRNSGLDAGWSYNMASASRIISGAGEVEVQGAPSTSCKRS